MYLQNQSHSLPFKSRTPVLAAIVPIKPAQSKYGANISTGNISTYNDKIIR